MTCSLLQLIGIYTSVDLPYSLTLQPYGWEIHDSAGMRYPLFLLIEPPISQPIESQKTKKNEGK